MLQQGDGGVDLLDNMVACYRIQFRKKKWWFPIYTWSLNVSAVNAWRLRQRRTGKKEPFLPFLRELVMAILLKNGTPPSQGRRSLELPPALRESSRYTVYCVTLVLYNISTV